MIGSVQNVADHVGQTTSSVKSVNQKKDMEIDSL